MRGAKISALVYGVQPTEYGVGTEYFCLFSLSLSDLLHDQVPKYMPTLLHMYGYGQMLLVTSFVYQHIYIPVALCNQVTISTLVPNYPPDWPDLVSLIRPGGSNTEHKSLARPTEYSVDPVNNSHR